MGLERTLVESGFCEKLIQGGKTDATPKDGETLLVGRLVAVVKTLAAVWEGNERGQYIVAKRLDPQLVLDETPQVAQTAALSLALGPPFPATVKHKYSVQYYSPIWPHKIHINKLNRFTLICVRTKFVPSEWAFFFSSNQTDQPFCGVFSLINSPFQNLYLKGVPFYIVCLFYKGSIKVIRWIINYFSFGLT